MRENARGMPAVESHHGRAEGVGDEPMVTRARSVVVIASDFPPLAGTNTQRIQSFVKYLPEFAWTPCVVTRSVDDMLLIDSSQMKNLPDGLVVRRCASPDPFLWLRRRRHRQPHDIAISKAQTDTPSTNARPASGRWPILSLSGLLKTALRYLAYLPDDQMLWGRVAARAARRLIVETGADVLLTSCPTYSTHVAGLWVKRKTGVFWIADFRDLWVGRPGRAVPSRWHDYWDRKLEAAVLRQADAIVVLSPPWKERLCKRYDDMQLADKITVVTNGFDSGKMPRRSEHVPDRPRIVFTNTGAMYGSESPAPFIEALGEVLAAHPDARDRVEVRLIGYAGDEWPKVHEIMRRYDLEGVVHYLGPQSHPRCLEEQMSADVLLLFSGLEHEETIRGKSYEYMATGKTILALIPTTGIQAELLRGAGTAHIVQHGDVASTRQLLSDLISKPALRAMAPDWAYIRQFERRTLTQRLVGVLEAAVAAGRKDK